MEICVPVKTSLESLAKMQEAITPSDDFLKAAE
jgi:hypothetical protein